MTKEGPSGSIKKRGLSGYLHVWCGEHNPQNETCSVHGLRLRELHITSEHLNSIFNLRAVFFCPVLECDKYSYPKPGDAFPVVPAWAGSSELGGLILHLCALNKILFHKLVEREGDGK